MGIGRITSQKALQYGLSGVMLRSTGISYDLRKQSPYELYSLLDFNVPTLFNGDCFDRYLLRVQECRESLSMVKQLLNFLSTPNTQPITTAHTFTKVHSKTSMESLIQHFKLYANFSSPLSGEFSISTEVPKGELSLTLAPDGTNKLHRLKIRCPDYNALQALNPMASNHYLADMVAIVGSLDIVFGSIDR